MKNKIEINNQAFIEMIDKHSKDFKQQLQKYYMISEFKIYLKQFESSLKKEITNIMED